MSADDLHALTGAYAMDALDDLERARFERHLASCAECAREVAELRETATALGSLTDTPPPAGLRDRVLADIGTVRPLPPPSAAPRRRRWRPLVAAAAAAVVVGLGTVTAVEQLRDDPAVVSVSDRILRAPDAESIRTDLPGRASARIVRSVSQRKAVLITSDMSEPPPGKVYELWLQSPAGEMLPAGLMSAGGDREVLLEGDAATAVGAGITVEPAGGSDTPTSAPIALFDFGQAT